MGKIDVNCDVGEGLNNEDAIMPYIQSCNIACGSHAGDEKQMQNIVALAIEYKVKIGAHPSYPDEENFGRKTMIMEPDEFKKSIQNQINLLLKIVKKQGASLHHIKPHGALYNDLAKSDDLSVEFLNAVMPYKNMVKLYVPYNSAIEKNALKKGFSIIYEAFADRNYNDDLSLVSRQEKEALITNPKLILQKVLEMVNTQKVTTVSGKKVPIKAATFCVHSDTENAVEIVRVLNQNNFL
ncbi:MAG: lactam utilization protein LamB [Flavobacteria bacterium RIFCSPLOWO2_12_FULL_35_11]|nr:MAG: lactam utilization protein LamB [Flavobacteria bacterium RIFCSPLOWO2_12_FULL_35_11]